MPEINAITPVASQIKPQPAMSLADMVGLARGVQAYQQAEQVNPLALQEAQQKVEQAQYKTTQDKLTTEKQTRGYASSLIAGHLADPDFDINNPNQEAIVKKLEATKRYWDDLGINTPADKTLTGLIKFAKEDPKQAVQAMRTMAQQSLTNTEQGSQLNAPATMVNTGPTVYPLYQSPYQGAGAGRTPQVQLGISPNQRMEPTGKTDAAGNPTAYQKDQYGNIIGEVVIPAGVQAPQPGGQNPAVPSNVPVRMPFETPENITKARNIQLNANEAARGVQTSQFNNNKIIGLADKALVGSNAELLSKLGGGFAAVPWTSDATQNRQILGHQLALETANLAAGAGLGTDAARGLAERMSGTTDWTPEAIKSTARMNRALTTGTDMFNRGVNAAVAAAQNNPIAARDFQNKWSTQEQLVPTLQFIDALRNAKDDPAGAKAAVDAVGGYGSPAYKAMLQRAGKLNELMMKGQ